MIDISLVKGAKSSLGLVAAEIIRDDLGIHKWDERHLKGCCPFHSEKTPSFSYDKKKNQFKCFGCGKTYDIIDHYIEYYNLSFIEAVKRLFDKVGIDYDFDLVRSVDEKIKNKDREPYRFPKPEKSELGSVISYLKTRGFSDEAISYSDIKSDGKGNIAFEYRNENGKLLMVKYRPGRKLSKSDNKAWSQKGADTSPLLWGMDKVNIDKPLIITEGEMDRVAVITAGFKNVVSVPFGAGNYHWIEYNFKWLEQFERIIIWADNDEAGDKMRKEVIPRLGESRCLVVRSKFKDANEVLFKKGPDEVKKCIESAEEIPIKDIVDMADVEDFDINRCEKIKSGFSKLDKHIRGFVIPSIDVITGINSSGKSTVINQMCICEALQQGYKTFIYSGELTGYQLKNWIEYPMAGKHVSVKESYNGWKEYSIPKPIKEKMKEWYRGKIFFYSNEEDNRACAILKKMEEVARRYGVKNFILDNLMTIDLSKYGPDKYETQKCFVLDLKKFSRKFNCVIHLVAHPRKLDIIKRLNKMDVAGSGDITNLADYVLAIHRVTPQEKSDDKSFYGEFDTLIDLFKNRPLGAQDKVLGFKFDIKSKRLFEKEVDLEKDYGWFEQYEQLPMEEVFDEQCPF